MDTAAVENVLKEKIRDIPDWPITGVIFRDITTVLQDPESFKLAVDSLYELVKDVEFDTIAAVESRGFIFGATLAYKMGKGFIPIRKPGKLPHETVSQKYTLEYGEDEIQIHKDAVAEGDRVLILDDLIATGGSSKASANLIEKLGGEVAAIAFLIELTSLNGREKLKGYDVRSIVRY